MRKLLLLILLIGCLVMPVSAMEIEPPDIPDTAELYMPENTESFGEGLWYVIRSAINAFLPELGQTASTCALIVGAMILVSLADNFPGASPKVVHLVGAVLIGVIALNPASALIRLGMDTVTELTEYGKLLIPVLTGALAAQGGATSSTALYATTIFFVTVLTAMVTKLIIPMLYIYFCLALVNSAVGEELIKNLRDFMKWLISWSLKTVLYLFTGFMTITGVVSGTADATATKAVKLTISGMIPVVGGIISEASESILISAAVMKNAAGIYGILAIVAIFVGPFLKIGAQYLMLKLTGAVCGIFSGKQESELLKDFSGGMGMVLGMTGTVCLLLLISVVCFMKGVA